MSESLQHIALLCNDTDPRLRSARIDETETEAHIRCRAEFIHTVRDLGGTVLQNKGELSQFETFFAENEHAYTRVGLAEYSEKVRGQLPALIPGFADTRSWSFMDADFKTVEASLPYLLAFTKERGGDGKYLIETMDQHTKARDYVMSRDPSSVISPYVSIAEARRYIETPSDRYTSYRLLATATGGLVAAGLLYSAHTKNSDRRVVTSFRSTSIPGSPCYLHARDVRSNIAQGGAVIPLMGENRRLITSEERDILAAHGINPDAAAVPEAIRQLGRAVARVYGRKMDTYFGLDFIQSTTTPYFLECNIGPGSKTYAACHAAGGLPDYGQMHESINKRLVEDMLADAR